MSTRNYLITCAAITVVTAASILLIPAVAQSFETILLLFLSTNAR